MAITKVGAMTDPPVAGDYAILQAKLDAYAKQIGNQGMILTQWTNTTTVPKIAMGSYITHGGTLFVVDTDDFAVPAPAGDGTYYLKVAVSGATLALSWVASIAGYTWNAIYNGLYDANENQILPYQLVKAGATLTKRKITNLMQGGGFVTVDWTGAMIGQALNVASIDTGQGATEVHLMNQNLRTTDSVHFANINPPVDNNDASMPSVGIGGFSYAVGSTSTDGAYPSITIGSGGTWVYIAHSTRATSGSQTQVGRIAGGSSVQGRIAAQTNEPASVTVIAWRIA